MSGDRLKTVGIKPAVWRELKKYATDHEMTLSDVIERLLERSKEVERNADGRSDRKPTDPTD